MIDAEFDSCVLLVCNREYMDYASAVLRQIQAMEVRNFDLVVASPDDLTADACEVGAKYLYIDVSGFIETLPTDRRLKNYCYWRFPAIELLTQSYKRILYLDIDIFCAAPGVAALFDVAMGDRAIAAVTDVHVQYRPLREIPEFVSAGLDHAGYFNSGVLLVDGENWQSMNAMGVLESTCRKLPDALVRHDQSALNLVFYRNWLEMSPVWNWQYSKRNAYASLHAGARLYHYSGSKKLWNSGPDSFVKDHWLRFQQLTSSINPEANFEKAIVDVDRKMMTFLIASLWYRRSLLNYLSRFNHDFDFIDHGILDDVA